MDTKWPAVDLSKGPTFVEDRREKRIADLPTFVEEREDTRALLTGM